MALEDELRDRVAADPVGLVVELGRSREMLEQLDALRSEAASRVAALEWLASLVNDRGRNAGKRQLTLHAAMAAVLEDAPQRRMRPKQLAAEIDRRDLYRMRDGRPVEAQQIHARVGHYSEMFARDGAYIVLIQPEGTSNPGGVSEGSGPSDAGA